MFSAKADPTSSASVKGLGLRVKLSLATVLLTSATAALAIQEIDPNNTCALAQNVGALSANATITVTGALKTPPTVPDIDFYKFTGGTPGNLLRVSLHAASDGVDTLILPVVGVFNSSCGLTFNSGAYDPISFEVTVPPDGVVVLAVTSCCDFGFIGVGSYAGSYTLTASEIVPVTSISGRAVDATTAQPVPGLQVNLTLCQDPACAMVSSIVGFGNTDSLGQFAFTSTFYGLPLDPGTYEVTLQDFSGRYETAVSPPFSAASGEQKVIPDIAMVSIPVIGSISGRIVDSVTHAPLSGVSPPYAHLSLFGCSGFACSFVSGYADSSGRFKFDHDESGRGIVANASFSLYVAADQYQQLFTTVAPIGAGVNQNLGDIQVVSYPIRFGVLQGCSNVPVTGGVCQYEVEITNGTASTVLGQAWATIQAFSLGSFAGGSLFQTGQPQEMYLAGATRTAPSSHTASFSFAIPGTVPIYAFICPTFWFGVGANPQLYTQGSMQDFANCVHRTATGFTPATAEQIEALRREAREHEAKERQAVSPK